MGAGVAFFDADNDGDQDLLFVNSDDWPGHRPADTPAATLALYANDGSGRFTDITAQAGLDTGCYGMGVAAADIDNDGWQDLFITCVGGNRLFRNDEGRFTEITGKAGVAGADVVGRRGMSRIKSLLLGSVSRRILRGASDATVVIVS